MEQKLKRANRIRTVGLIIVLISFASLFMSGLFIGLVDHEFRKNPADKIAVNDSRIYDSWRQTINRYCIVTPGDGKRYYIVYNRAEKSYDSSQTFDNDYFYYVIVQDESSPRLYMPEMGYNLFYLGPDELTGEDKYLSPLYGVKTYLADDYTLTDMTHLKNEFMEGFSLCEENANNILLSIPTFEEDDILAQVPINARDESGIYVLSTWIIEIVMGLLVFALLFIPGVIVGLIGLTRVRLLERKMYLLGMDIPLDK